MITYSTIQKSQLEGANRLDAEYYQLEYLDMERRLKLTKSKVLFELAQVTGGKRLPVGDIFSEKGIPYLRVMDIYDTFVDLQGIKYISEKLHKLLITYQIQNGDILVTIVGNTVGLIGYNQYNLNQFNFTENCARVRAKELSSEYLLIVFLSRIGQLQVDRERVGTAQPKLSLDRLRNFIIPVPASDFQEQVKEAVQTSIILNQDSVKFYQEAENLLLEELGMGGSWIPDQVGNDKTGALFSIVNFSDVKSAERMDAEYYQPKYAKLEKKIKEHQARRLGDLVSVKKGFEPGAEAYLEEGKLFIRVSSLTKQGIIEKDQKYLSENSYKELKKDYEPKVGEILLTKDASPGIAYVVKEPVEGIISGGIVRLKLKEQNIYPEYLAFCISSIVGQSQAQRDAGGSVIMHWKPEQIKNLLVPVLPQNVQKKISELVIQSHEARKKAKELLEEAKRKVEEIIEKGVSRA